MDRQSPLEPPDLERLAIAAYLIGRDADALDVLTRAHNAFLTQLGGRSRDAGRFAHLKRTYD